MTIIDDAKAAGFPVWDGKTPHKCPDCDFITSYFHEYTQHMINQHPPDFGAPGVDVDQDLVMEATIKRCLSSLFTGNLADGLAAVADYSKARRKN